jgi:hypothetical protein
MILYSQDLPGLVQRWALVCSSAAGVGAWLGEDAAQGIWTRGAEASGGAAGTLCKPSAEGVACGQVPRGGRDTPLCFRMCPSAVFEAWEQQGHRSERAAAGSAGIARPGGAVAPASEGRAHWQL